MKMQTDIRRAVMADAATIAEVGRKAFAESFGHFNTSQNLQAHLDRTYRPKLIQEQMDSGAKYLIVEVNQVAAGFGKLRESVPPECIPTSRPIEIHQIYLLAEFHRRGIGTELMAALLKLAHQMNGDGVYLGVYEKADWGISFYESCGFTKVGQHVFRVGDDDQIDWLMHLRLEDHLD